MMNWRERILDKRRIFPVDRSIAELQDRVTALEDRMAALESARRREL
jgi:hypothetical protein